MIYLFTNNVIKFGWYGAFIFTHWEVVKNYLSRAPISTNRLFLKFILSHIEDIIILYRSVCGFFNLIKINSFMMVFVLHLTYNIHRFRIIAHIFTKKQLCGKPTHTFVQYSFNLVSTNFHLKTQRAWEAGASQS